MRIRFWGVRGSIPVPGPSTVRVGGNTPCVEVETEKRQVVILDAGTGIRLLGLDLAARRGGRLMAVLLFSHTHWDHIQGLPFFSPARLRHNRLVILGERRMDRFRLPGGKLGQHLARPGERRQGVVDQMLVDGRGDQRRDRQMQDIDEVGAEHHGEHAGPALADDAGEPAVVEGGEPGSLG